MWTSISNFLPFFLFHKFVQSSLYQFFTIITLSLSVYLKCRLLPINLYFLFFIFCLSLSLSLARIFSPISIESLRLFFLPSSLNVFCGIIEIIRLFACSNMNSFQIYYYIDESEKSIGEAIYIFLRNYAQL